MSWSAPVGSAATDSGCCTAPVGAGQRRSRPRTYGPRHCHAASFRGSATRSVSGPLPTGDNNAMSSGHKTVTVFLTLICGLILTIVGFCTQWPLWAWPTAAFALIATPVAALRLATRHQDPFAPEYLQEPDRPLPPVERRELRIIDVALPSQLDDYDFLLSATVRWCPVAAAKPILLPSIRAGSPSKPYWNGRGASQNSAIPPVAHWYSMSSTGLWPPCKRTSPAEYRPWPWKSLSRSRTRIK